MARNLPEDFLKFPDEFVERIRRKRRAVNLAELVEEWKQWKRDVAASVRDLYGNRTSKIR